MKIVVFGSRRRVGAILDDCMVDLNAAHAARIAGQGIRAGGRDAVPATLGPFIRGGRATLDQAQLAIEWVTEQRPESGATDGTDAPVVQPIDAVHLRAPSVRNARTACAGGNFARHVAGARATRGEQVTVEQVHRELRQGGPWGFWKVGNTVLGPGDDLEYPARAQRLDYEGEAAVVLAHPAKDVRAAEADRYIWGVTLVNDWSIRNPVPPRILSFNENKNFDGATSLGPCIVVGIADPQDVVVETRVNGTTRQRLQTFTC